MSANFDRLLIHLRNVGGNHLLLQHTIKKNVSRFILYDNQTSSHGAWRY